MTRRPPRSPRLTHSFPTRRSSDLAIDFETSEVRFVLGQQGEVTQAGMIQRNDAHKLIEECMIAANVQAATYLLGTGVPAPYRDHDKPPERSEEHTSELQSLMRNSYAVFCLKKKKQQKKRKQ